jgi:hypothetical protein
MITTAKYLGDTCVITIEIVRFDPRKTILRDIVVGVALSRLFIQAPIWLKTS